MAKEARRKTRKPVVSLAPERRPATREPNQFGEIEHWIGTLEGCPRQNLTILGVTFHRFTEKVTHPKGALKTQRERRKGGIVMMSEAKAIAIRDNIASKVCTQGKRGRIDLKAKYRNLAGTEVRPLGDFLYMVPMKDAVDLLGANWRDGDPLPLSQMDENE